MPITPHVSFPNGFLSNINILPHFTCQDKNWHQFQPSHSLITGTNYERTFVMIKPDAVQRGLIAEILGRFEKKGFKVVGLKMVNPDERLIRAHYDDLKSRPFFRDLVDYMSTAGPVIAVVLEGKDVIRYSRTMIGETSPSKSPVGSIRGDLATDVSRNIIHGSDAAETAQHEIQLWFGDEEVNNWQPSTAQWQYEDI